MKFVCQDKNCPGVGLSDTGCSRCQFAVTPQGVIGFAFRSMMAGIRARLGVRCPLCTGVIPAFQSTCPGCKSTLTVERVVEDTLGPTRERAKQIIAPTPAKVAAFRWGYLVLSAIAFCALFGVLQMVAFADILLPAILSTFYLGLFLGLFVWMVPQSTVVALNRRAPKRIKLALLLNFLTCVIVLNLAVKEWWARATLLAALFASIGFGFWFFWRFLWPILGANAHSGPRPFNPQDPQGRNVETE